MTKSAEEFLKKIFPDGKTCFAETDPEFNELFCDFAFDEVMQTAGLNDKTRFLAILAALTGCQSLDAYREMLPAALRLGILPEQVKEMLYQATAYLGYGKVFSFLKATNEVFTKMCIGLPLGGKKTAERQNRAKAGEQKSLIQSPRISGSARPVISDIIFGSRPAASILCATDRFPTISPSARPAITPSVRPSARPCFLA